MIAFNQSLYVKYIWSLEPITVGPCHLTSPLSTFPMGENRETHDFRKSVVFTCRMGSCLDVEKFLLRIIPATLEVKGISSNHLATEALSMTMTK